MNRQYTSIIQRQVLEISAAGSASGLEWERYAAAYMRDFIAPAIEACFRDLPYPDQHLVIEKLEIDLGTFSRSGFEKEAVQKLIDLLKKQLQRCYKHFTGLQEYNGNKHAKTGMDWHQAGRQHASNDEASKGIVLNKQEAKQIALLQFLKQGRFPWWYTAGKQGAEDKLSDRAGSRGPGLAAEFDQDWLQALNEQELAALKETVIASPAAAIRLVNHFSTAWIISFLSRCGQLHPHIPEYWEMTAPVLKKYPGVFPIYQQHFWTSCLKGKAGESIPIINIIEKTAGRRTALAVELAQALYKAASSMTNDTYRKLAEATGQYLDVLNEKAADKSIKADALHPSPATASAKVADQEPGSRELVEKALKEIFQRKQEEGADTGFGEDEALYVPAAGIVLLHPFFAELFRETELWNGNAWTTPESPYRAIRLLSYLAYGETGLPEYELLFFKLLTGLSIETALPAGSPLTEKEENACMELLQAVIGHWTALRNTSPGGLQEGFLQRQGKITRGSSGIQLTVERLAQDVLLGHLPWGYSMIRLPWMEEMLHVSWI